MKLCLLRSGSSGNCTFIEHGKTKILLDAGGLSQNGFRGILAEIGVDPRGINAIVASHLHSDHLNESALSLFGKLSIPVWVHEENIPVLRRSLGKKKSAAISIQSFGDEPFVIEEVEFHPFLVDHDARNTTNGFKFRDAGGNGRWVSFATDLGCFPDCILPYFVDSAVIVLESNHDIDLLWNNPQRPFFHKKRVASDTGHLSNEQAVQALLKICSASRRHPSHIVLSHLSKDHNSPALALDHIGRHLSACGYRGNLLCAMRDRKMEFIEVGDH